MKIDDKVVSIDEQQHQEKSNEVTKIDLSEIIRGLGYDKCPPITIVINNNVNPVITNENTVNPEITATVNNAPNETKIEVPPQSTHVVEPTTTFGIHEPPLTIPSMNWTIGNILARLFP